MPSPAASTANFHDAAEEEAPVQPPGAAILPDGSMVMLLSPKNPYQEAVQQEQSCSQVNLTEVSPRLDPAVLDQFHGPLQLERMLTVVFKARVRVLEHRVGGGSSSSGGSGTHGCGCCCCGGGRGSGSSCG